MFSAPLTNARRAVSRSAGKTLSRGLSTAAEHTPVIVAISRTPIGTFNGSLASLTGPQLSALTIADCLKKSGIDPKEIDEVLLGNVVGANLGQAPATQAASKAGVPFSVPTTVVNKVCSSGMKAIMFAAQSIALGQNKCVVAGGFESMSNIPYYVPKARNGYNYGHGELLDGVLKDGLWDPIDNHHMGACAEACATEYGFTREQQDAYALESYRRAEVATKNKLFQDEIVGVEIQGKKDKVVITEDEQFKKLVRDKVATLRPAFKKDGSVTAANASALNDGAASVIVTSLAYARERNLTPLARIAGYADAAKRPLEFTTAPALAIPRALSRAGLSASDISFYEINEAFSVVALANMKLLGLDHSKLNVNGGAVALGHPIGCSGARITLGLANILRQNKARYGVAAICNGGGGASAIVLERL